jgi:osmotically-inducible protein OsmY
MMDTPYRVATTTAGGLPGSPDESRPLHTVEQDDVPALTGVAANLTAWREARDAALGAPGVIVVADESDLVGARSAQHPEHALQVAHAVLEKLRLLNSHCSVLVACNGSVVTLSGRAGELDKRAAGVAAWSVPGVGYVQNWIRTPA